MCNKSEIFAKILRAVSVETEISSSLILSSNRQIDVVDARALLVKLLHDKGLYNHAIAKLISRTTRAISITLSNFDYRLSNNKMMRINYEILKKQVESI